MTLNNAWERYVPNLSHICPKHCFTLQNHQNDICIVKIHYENIRSKHAFGIGTHPVGIMQ